MNEKIKAFSLLEKENKRKKLLDMLGILNWWNNIFTDIISLMKELKENISESFMNSIYTILIEIMENLKKEEIWKSVNNLEKIKNKFLEFKKYEEEERKKELIESENTLI